MTESDRERERVRQTDRHTENELSDEPRVPCLAAFRQLRRLHTVFPLKKKVSESQQRVLSVLG